MTEANQARPRIPWVTIAVQVMGAAALWLGVRIILDAARCHAEQCTGLPSQAAGIAAVVWGVIALLSGLRGRLGFVALIAAIVTPLVVSWAKFGLGILFLIVILGATSASKEQLAPYYRGRSKEASL